MASIEVAFTHLVQDSQEYGSTDEHMVSRVFFDLKVGGKVVPNVYVNVKQTVGSSFETAPLEVSAPQGYEGPLSHEELRRHVEKYYRGLVGSAGSGIRIVGNAKNIRMRNNTFKRRELVTVIVPPASSRRG